MCAQNQDILYALDGICESPQDFPAKWAAMIFGFFDESGESGDGFYVVAGFVGRKRDWKKYLLLWQEAKSNHGPLHMKDLRLGSQKATVRYGELLKTLGKVPRTAGLRPFSGSVRTSDFSDRTNGTIASLVMTGYSIALTAMIDALFSSDLPKQDRIEFIFEEQVAFASSRAQAFSFWRTIPEFKTHHGKSRIAKDSSIEKGSLLLEASDYLAYAILQRVLDENSQKARLSSPILDNFDHHDHKHLSKEQAHIVIDKFQSSRPSPSLGVIHSKEHKKWLNDEMKRFNLTDRFG